MRCRRHGRMAAVSCFFCFGCVLFCVLLCLQMIVDALPALRENDSCGLFCFVYVWCVFCFVFCFVYRLI